MMRCPSSFAGARLLVFLLGTSALMTSSCGSGGDVVSADAGSSEQGGMSCSVRADCAALGDIGRGLICGASGRCENCVGDGQCGLKERCSEDTARCIFKEGFGDDCALNDDCPGGSFCVQGLCVSALDAAFCVDGTCLAGGQRCHRQNGVCEIDLGCLEDADCTTEEVCNVPTRTCVSRCTPENYASVCRPGEVCLKDRCSACSEEKGCGNGLVCDVARLSCVSEGALTRCIGDGECPGGTVCDRELGVCLPPRPACTSDEGCAADQRCQIASGKCLPRQCEPDRFEPNGTMEAALSAARDLTAGTYSGLTLCNGDIDHFTVALHRGDRLAASLSADVLLEGRVSAAVVDPLGRTLGAGSLSAEGTAVMDGRHAVRVSSDERWVSYGLELSISSGTPCDFDDFEPNDTAAAATVVEAAGTLRDLTLCGGDEDFFEVRLPEGRRAIARAQAVSGTAAVNVEPADVPESSADAADASDAAQGGSARWQLFRVFSPLARAHVSYELTIAFEDSHDSAQ